MWVEKGLLKKIMSWLLKYPGNEVQGREDKYFINMCRWIYGWACHSSPVVFSSARGRSVSCPLKNHTFSFSGLCKASNIRVLFLLKPILSCSITPKTDSTRKKIKILCQLYRRWLEKWGVVSVKYQNFKERRLQHLGSCFVSLQPCPSLGRVRSGAVLGGARL